jgi:hypothetical protein
MAQARFDEYMGGRKVSRATATERTAADLRTQPGVAKVTVRGTGSLFILWDNGDELLMLLGRDRL